VDVLRPNHFGGEVVALARDLIGRELIVHSESERVVAIVIETEAYAGIDDPASHAAFRPGGRAAAMFGPPGTIYIYAAYGMYPCLNIVTGAEGVPSAILVRGIALLESSVTVSGPGRLTRQLGVTLADHGRMLGDGRFDVSVRRHECDIIETPRVGITRGMEHPWRFLGQVADGVLR
jgi:DNA-3-methyladenine glycosylase